MTELAAAFALLLAVLAAPRTMLPADTPRAAGAPSATNSPPSATRRAVVFEPNVGQFEPGVRYRAHVAGRWLSITDTAIELSLGPEPGAGRSIRVRPVGASLRARPVALDRLPGVVNHFESAAPSAWHAGVPTFRRVRYAAVYPDIDLVYHGSPDQLEYDFVVARGADPSRIAMRFDGADRVEIEPAGDLLIHAGDTILRQPAPVAWQDHGHERRRVDVRYRLTSAGDVALTIDAYDRRAPLVVDPILLYSSYLHSYTPQIAVDGAGNVVVATEQSFYARGLKVERLSPDGQTSIYTSLFAGTSDYLVVAGVGAAADGSAVVAGWTTSANLPLVNASQGFPGDTTNGFVVKLDPSGGVVFSTYLGGTSSDSISAVSVNAAGTIAVAGGTGSPDFPGVDGLVSGPTEGFITLFSPTGARLHGALLPARIKNVVIDAAGSVFVASNTQHINWPTTPTAFEPTPLQALCVDDSPYPCEQGVVAKLSADLRSLVYSTYLHPTDPRMASSDLRVYALAVDPSGAAYILASGFLGTTPGALFPQCLPNSFCVFLAKLNPAGSGLVYSTYLRCCAYAMQVDARGNAYLAGEVSPSLTGFAPTALAQQPGPGDALLFVTTDGGATWHPSLGVYENGSQVALVHTTGPLLYSAYSKYPDRLLFRSTDLGNHWEQVDSQMWGSLSTVQGNPNVLYEGPSRRLLRRSSDGGATWALVPIPIDASTFAVDPIDPQTLYIGGDEGVFKSVNGGYAWSPVGGIPGRVQNLVVSSANHNLVFASVFLPWPIGRWDVYRSVDGGASWSVVALPTDASGYWMTFDPLDATRIYATGPGNGRILRSVDGGASWTPFLSCYCRGLAVTHAPNAALFVVSTGGLARVTDTGVPVSALPPPVLKSSNVGSLLIDPVDPRIMFAAQYDGVEGFVSVLDPTGSRMRYASYFGGSDHDYVSQMALGAGGTLAILGQTHSRDLPLVNPRTPDPGGPLTDSFVAVMRIPLPTVVLDAPGAGSITSPFTVSGWAIDTGAPAGPGVDAVHVWALPQNGGAAAFVGVATYGGARPDVGSIFGSQFTNSGFSLTGASLPAGPYTLAAAARSTVSGTFEVATRSVTVIAGGRMAVDLPAPGASLSQPFAIAGWALDTGAPSGTGIDAVHVWAFPVSGAPRFVGVAAYGIPRPDVGAAFGSRFTGSGFALQANGLDPGAWTLAVFGHSTATGNFDLVKTVGVTIPSAAALRTQTTPRR